MRFTRLQNDIQTTCQTTRFPYPLRAEMIPAAASAAHSMTASSSALPAIPAHPAHPRLRQRHGQRMQKQYPQLSYPAARAFFHAGGTLYSCPPTSMRARPAAERVADCVGAVMMFAGFYGLLLVT
jgi:hypothetical protein